MTAAAVVIEAATGHALRPGLGNGRNIAVAEGGTTGGVCDWLPGTVVNHSDELVIGCVDGISGQISDA